MSSSQTPKIVTLPDAGEPHDGGIASPPAQGPDDPFAHGGEAGEILRAVDWSRKPIGPVASWPQSLRTALSICLSSRYPICILWGRDRLYLYNDAYTPIVGAKHPWALGESYVTVWPEIWESSIRPILETVERTGSASWCDNLLLVLQRRGFNEECYFSFSFAPTRIEDGTVGGVFTAITETTPQVVGERRSRTLRELGARTAAADTPDDVCHLAAEVFAANPYDIPFVLFYLTEPDGTGAKLVRQVGLDSGHPACVPAVALTGGEDRAWPFAAAAMSPEPIVVTDLAQRFEILPGGPWPEAAHTAMVLPIARGGQVAPYGFIVAGISPRRMFDDEYRSFLTLAVTQVAGAVSNAEAYAEARRRAEALAEIDRAKTAFFSNVSHEFRTPLTLMLGPLEELLARPDATTEPVRKQLEITHRNCLRLLKLVNSLLDFSRIEAGRLQASFEPVDLGTLTTELCALFRAAIEKAGLALVVNCPPTRVPVFVDQDLWEKIVFNLLSNAFKFTLEGGIEVVLTEQNGYVELAVRDTGVGIAESELPNIFKRFHRVENVRSRTHEGTGIGLALAQELARMHGGDIHVASRLGSGSTFTVRLPTGQAHLPAERIRGARNLASTRLAASAFTEEALRWLDEPEAALGAIRRPIERGGDSGPPSRDRKAARILIADDNADMRLYLRNLLEDSYDVELAGDGEAALAAIQRRKPDLILTDIMMPRLDGLGLLRAVRASPATQLLPVIFLSARANQEASVEGYEAGADDYLIKPFSAAELLARVGTHLRLSELRTNAANVVERERRLYQTILSNTPDLVGVFDVNRRCTYANDALLRTWGCSWQHAAGRPCRELGRSAEESATYDRAIAQVIATGQNVRGEAAVANAHGRRIFDYIFVPVMAATGEVEAIAGTIRDITEMVRARDTVAQHQSELERLVQERTARLQEAVEQMEEFSYSISHDLRSPTRAMYTYAEALLEDHAGSLDAKARELLGRIRRNSARMDRLIRDLLTYSRISRREILLEPVSPAALIQELILEYPELQPARAEIAIAGPLPPVKAHEPSLSQALSNLLTNAVKYVAPGTRPRVRVRGESAGTRVRIWIEDNGIGIPPQHQRRIFGMFERVNPKDGYDGTGIGLAIVRKAIERMQGSVGVESDGVAGSRFWIELPAALPA